MTSAYCRMVVCVVVLLTTSFMSAIGQEKERTKEQIKAARDFEFEKLTFSSSLEDLLKLFPDSRVYAQKKGPMLVNTKDKVVAFVFFDEGYKNLKDFRIIYGDVPIKKMGGVGPVYKDILKRFGAYDGKPRETKESDGLLIECLWTYDPKVERTVKLSMKEYDSGIVNIAVIVTNTAVK